MRSIICLILIFGLCLSNAEELDSKIRFRLYKKAIHEIIEKNGNFVEEYLTVPFGSVDIGDISLSDSSLKLIPQSGNFNDFESELVFFAGEGIQISLNEFKFEVSGKTKDGEASLTGDIDSILLKFLVQNREKSDKKSDDINEKYNIPDFEIGEFKVVYDKETFNLKVNGENKITPEFKEEAAKWIDQVIEGQTMLVKFILNAANSQFAEYIKDSIKLDQFQGDVQLSALKIESNYLELGIDAGYERVENDEFKLRETDELISQAGDSGNAIELVVDENTINIGLYSLFHSDDGFDLRQILRIGDASNEYGPMFDQVFTTSVLGQGWKELEKEYGADKRVNAKCSFGKSLFKDLVKDIKPSQIRFLKGSSVDFTIGFGCSVLVENEQGEYENFRSFFGELYTKLKISMVSNDASKRIKMEGDVQELRALRIKIFKQKDPMIAEETSMIMMMNMGLSMLKSQISQALQIPEIGYPTIKACTGLTLLRPSIIIYDGFIVISTDLGIKSATKGCTLLNEASFTTEESSVETTEEDRISTEGDDLNEDL